MGGYGCGGGGGDDGLQLHSTKIALETPVHVVAARDRAMEIQEAFTFHMSPQHGSARGCVAYASRASVSTSAAAAASSIPSLPSIAPRIRGLSSSTAATTRWRPTPATTTAVAMTSSTAAMAFTSKSLLTSRSAAVPARPQRQHPRPLASALHLTSRRLETTAEDDDIEEVMRQQQLQQQQQQQQQLQQYQRSVLSKCRMHRSATYPVSGQPKSARRELASATTHTREQNEHDEARRHHHHHHHHHHRHHRRRYQQSRKKHQEREGAHSAPSAAQRNPLTNNNVDDVDDEDDEGDESAADADSSTRARAGSGMRVRSARARSSITHANTVSAPAVDVFEDAGCAGSVHATTSLLQPRPPATKRPKRLSQRQASGPTRGDISPLKRAFRARSIRHTSTAETVKPARKRYLILGHKDAITVDPDKSITNPPGTPVEGTYDVLMYPSMRNVQSQVYVTRKLKQIAQQRQREAKRTQQQAERTAREYQMHQDEAERERLLVEQRARIYAFNAVMSALEQRNFQEYCRQRAASGDKAPRSWRDVEMEDGEGEGERDTGRGAADGVGVGANNDGDDDDDDDDEDEEEEKEDNEGEDEEEVEGGR
ncbi:hypothetical protein PTSG_07106 [Salpingoeca rosetta]|uniref:Small vasohibin-binding protein n=1 Tax=Salpingoeca rosetta (strain ATCC 50818 / BSB-021) TaxID=946362 RepID=F2UE28_SALR5|nr:uncharacterized protein PTSG_07106 [Salpingoeca rosetta]EGD74878.1 hypothetical protein PTSG_07106 [Salpingoeca rosetta]|eukprot:XP_004992523.1 hypothetical protein PTSG_07106 [Salpingoeca rosetta]